MKEQRWDRHVTFLRAGGAILRLSDAAVATMHNHVQRHPKSTEAGGILLGRMLMKSDDVVVDEVTVPGPHDSRNRFRFSRARQPAQTAVNDAWTRSSGELNYLGEWHTHPEDDPQPSGHDQKDWRRLVASQIYEQASLFFVIVGRRVIRAWEFTRAEACEVQLATVVDRQDDEVSAHSYRRSV